MAIESPTSSAITVMKATPAPKSRACSALVSWVMLTSIAATP